MRNVKLILGLLVAVILIAVYVQNDEKTFVLTFSTGLENWKFERDVPVMATVYGATIIGILISAIWASIRSVQRTLLIRKNVKTIDKLEQEVSALRNLPLEEDEKNLEVKKDAGTDLQTQKDEVREAEDPTALKE